jgi:uroporphyrinogen-III decarboxylase
MTRRERLMATLRGEPVDRPAVSFYEIGGFAVNPDDPDRYNIYNGPSWRPLLQLAEERTDLIRMRGPGRTPAEPGLYERFFRHESWEDGDTRWQRVTLTLGGRTMTSVTRRDAAVSTVWTTEHLLKDAADLKAYLEIPDAAFMGTPALQPLFDSEAEVGDRGVVMMDTGDPICWAASLFSMEDYTVLALTEPALFHTLLQKCARCLYPFVEAVARGFPGRLWRVVGPEYAGEPYLPPALFEEYVVRYTGPIIRTIQQYGGFARLHCHGRLRNILGHIAAMGPAGLDPIEPPGQGDISLAEVRAQLGKTTVLFGNIEASDLELLAPPLFERKVRAALEQGTGGRGFVLMPSAAPYGRVITPQTLANYQTMVRLAEAWR